jgi:hypothetical protein
MTPKIAAMHEIADFDMRYARKLQGPMVAGASADQMAAAMAMYPAMKDAIGRMNTENVKMDGTSIETTMKVDAVKSAAQMEQERQQSEDNRSSDQPGVGSMLGKFAKKMAERKSGGQNEQGSHATFMTMTSQVLKVTPDVTANDVSVPAGFREAK